MLSRTQLRQFLALVDTGSFTRAANALNIAQPSLSSGISQLEQQLGTRLFVRERRRIQLTDAGNQLLPLARSIEREFHRAEVEVGSHPVPVRPIRLGVLETLSSGWLARAIKAYPGPEPLELSEGGERALQAALANGSLDLAVTLVPQGYQGRSEAVLHEAYCLALAADHPLAGAREIQAHEVAGDAMIARRACEVLSETSRFFTARGVRPRFVLRSLNDDRAMAMVRAGLGITVAPQSLGGEGLAMVPIAQFGLTRTIGVVPASHVALQVFDKVVHALRATSPQTVP